MNIFTRVLFSISFLYGLRCFAPVLASACMPEDLIHELKEAVTIEASIGTDIFFVGQTEAPLILEVRRGDGSVFKEWTQKQGVVRWEDTRPVWKRALNQGDPYEPVTKKNWLQFMPNPAMSKEGESSIDLELVVRVDKNEFPVRMIFSRSETRLKGGCGQAKISKFNQDR